jgi:formylglycine-generating enzyme required for sulfatase activity
MVTKHDHDYLPENRYIGSDNCGAVALRHGSGTPIWHVLVLGLCTVAVHSTCIEPSVGTYRCDESTGQGCPPGQVCRWHSDGTGGEYRCVMPQLFLDGGLPADAEVPPDDAASDQCDVYPPGLQTECPSTDCPNGWILIEAGSFQRGCDPGELDNTCRPEEQPRHSVWLDSFCIQEAETSVSQFRECAESGYCDLYAPTSWDATTLCNWNVVEVAQGEDQPLNCVDWSTAKALCNDWFGGDLPTEAQWEKAARGLVPRKYPWGDVPEPDCDHCNFDINGDGSGHGCQSIESGAGTWDATSLLSGWRESWYRVLDMAGNVQEWTTGCLADPSYMACAEMEQQGTICQAPSPECDDHPPVIRGGSVDTRGATGLRTVARNELYPSTRAWYVGFRCVRRAQ